MRKNSIKNTRINSEVKKEISLLLHGELGDPRISPMTSVTDVEVATDLKTCKVYISVLGSEKEKKETLEAFKAASGFIRRELSRTVNLRNTPELSFILDETMEYASHMEELIRKANLK